MSGKVALITGVTGQDGAYLAELLLAKGYIVHGIKRRSSSFNTGRVDHLYPDPHEKDVRFFLHYGDLTDATNLIRLVQETQPDEIYNLAAQSHVQVSFETAEYTANADALGTLRLLEAIRILELENKRRFYQASTSELYGKVSEVPQTRDDAVLRRAAPTARPSSTPTGSRSIIARPTASMPRTAFCSITKARSAARPSSPARSRARSPRSSTGCRSKLYLGNLDAKRDWGHARDYVEGMWLMLQQPKPDDYVLATGEGHTVREFVERAFAEVGRRSTGAATGATRSASTKRAARRWSRSIRAISGRPRSIVCSATRARPSRSSAGSTGSHSTSWSPRWSTAISSSSRRDERRRRQSLRLARQARLGRRPSRHGRQRDRAPARSPRIASA